MAPENMNLNDAIIIIAVVLVVAIIAELIGLI